MAILQSKLATKQMGYHANMTELNHLGAGLMAKPHFFGDVMDTVFSSQNIYADNPMTSLLMQFGEEEISNMEWEWELKDASCRPLVVVESLTSGNQGKYNKPFPLFLDEDWYMPGDILTPGTSDKSLQVRIQSKRGKGGDGCVYTVVVNGPSSKSIPSRYLEPGQRWGKMFSQYEEGAQESGSTTFSTNIGLRSRMGKYRKKYEVTDYASTEALAVKIPHPTKEGKSFNTWMKYAEAEYWMQWYKELERAAWYSRSSSNVYGSTGRATRSGPGIQELLEDGHIYRYTHLTTKLIEEFLMDVFYNRVGVGKARHIKGYTGEFGMIKFHRAVQDWQNKSGFIKNIEVYTDKVKSNVHENALAAGYQYIMFRMANGSTLELVHNPLYDDPEINFEIDESTGFPKESQRITFLDFSGKGLEKNIKLVKKKDSNFLTYVNGNFGPYGPNKGGSSAHAGDYYEMHVGEVRGIQMTDPTKCGELILA